MNKLFEAVKNKNVPEVKEILKQCTREILEFRDGKVSIFSSICCCSTTINRSEIILFLACSIRVWILFFFTIFQFAKGVYYFIHQEFYLVRLRRYLKSHNWRRRIGLIRNSAWSQQLAQYCLQAQNLLE